MNEQIKRIKEKITLLRRLDKGYTVFGSQKHRYLINATVSVGSIREFEEKHRVTLPEGYTRFLTEIGNGGAGPFYGLEQIQDSLCCDLDYKQKSDLLNPGQPFLHTESWNMIFESSVDEEEDEYENEREKFEEKYFDKEHMNGVLAICNYGCAISLNLVVKGQEYGKMWTDDRGSDNGIHPSYELGNKGSIGFLEWYELWLDNSLEEVNEQLSLSLQRDKNIAGNQKSWWKFW